MAAKHQRKSSEIRALLIKFDKINLKVGTRWTDEEDKQLLEAFEAGTPIKGLADKHQRTRGAIHARLVKFGKIDPKAGIAWWNHSQEKQSQPLETFESETLN